MKTTTEERDAWRKQCIEDGTAYCISEVDLIRLLDDADRAAELDSAISQYITQLEQEIEKSATESHREAVGDERAALQGSVRRTVVRALRKRMRGAVTNDAGDSDADSTKETVYHALIGLSVDLQGYANGAMPCMSKEVASARAETLRRLASYVITGVIGGAVDTNQFRTQPEEEG